MEESIIDQYTTAGNSFRTSFAVPLIELLDACDEWINLYGDPSEQQADPSTTNTFLIN